MFKKILLTFLVSMVPIIELRGAVPIGISMDLPLTTVFPVCIVGNMIPVPFIIIFSRKIFAFLRSRGGVISKWTEKYEKKVGEKAKNLYKYELVGLALFVAIPLPGTGAWTGSCIAGVLNLRLRYAVPAVFAGIIIAGLIMSIVSYGAFAAIEAVAS